MNFICTDRRARGSLSPDRVQANSETENQNLAATRILDWRHPRLQQLARQITVDACNPRHYLQLAHRRLVLVIAPIYSVDEWQPASQTLILRAGSCSQRMACLEAIARAGNIPTRVRALQIAGTFWYPRFGLTRQCIPKQVLLLWPQFFLEQSWVDFDEIYGRLAERSSTEPFTNDAESIFEAVQNSAVDFFSKTCNTACSRSDISKYVLGDEGFFNSRDAALEHLGSFQYTFRGRLFEAVFGGRKST